MSSLPSPSASTPWARISLPEPGSNTWRRARFPSAAIGRRAEAGTSTVSPARGRASALRTTIRSSAESGGDWAKSAAAATTDTAAQAQVRAAAFIADPQKVNRAPSWMSRGLLRSWLMVPKAALRGSWLGFHSTV